MEGEKKKNIQVLPIDISTGSTWASDSLTSVQNRYINVFIGMDGAVYTIPIKVNKKDSGFFEVIHEGSHQVRYKALARLLAIKKIGSGAIPLQVRAKEEDPLLGFFSDEEFSRFCYVSTFQYGCINFFYDRTVVDNSLFDEGGLNKLKSFDQRVFNYKVWSLGDPYVAPDPVDTIKYFLGHSNINVAVDERNNNIVFPAFWMFQPFTGEDAEQEEKNPEEGDNQEYDRKDVFLKKCMGSIVPRNVVVCSIDAETIESERIKPLQFEKENEEHEIELYPITKNDFCHGCLSIGSHMVYYSQRFNELRNSKPITYNVLQKIPQLKHDEEESEGLTPSIFNVITFPFQVQDIEYHNNYLLVLRPNGIGRFSLNPSSSDTSLFVEDPLFFIKDLVRFNSAVKVIGTELLFFNEQGYVKTISSGSDASAMISELIATSLPKARGFPQFDKNEYAKPSGILSIFDMNFLYIGNWLINLSSQGAGGRRAAKVTNYQLDTLDGHVEKHSNNFVFDSADPSTTNFSVCEGDLIGDYNSIGKFLTYEETIIQMIDHQGDLPMSFDNGDYSYGLVKNITTKPLTRDSAFRVGRLFLTLRMDLLEGLASMPTEYNLNLFLKKIVKQQDDNFSYFDETTWTNVIFDEETQQDLPDIECIINLRNYVNSNIFSGDRKVPIVFFINLSNINYISFSLTWKGSYPLVIEKMEVEIEN